MTTREQLERINDLGMPEGSYTVELADARTGRTVDRVTAPNYVTPAYQRFVRWAQGSHFHFGIPPIDNNTRGTTYGMGPGGTGSTTTNWLAPPRINTGGIVCTDSTVAEDTGSEWGTGRTVAYGSRWKLTIPAEGRRGQINEAQSLLTADSVRLVWDFVETQGNGSFQSVHMADFTTAGSLTLPPTGYHYRYTHPGIASKAIELDLTYVNDAGTIAYGVCSVGTSSGDAIELYSVSLTDGTDHGDYYECSAPTKLATLAGITYNSSSTAGNLTSVRSGAVCSVFYVGGDWLMAWPGDDGECYLGRWNAAGVQQWAMEVIGPADTSTIYPASGAFVAADASKAYVGCDTNYIEAVHRKLYRVDLATQTVDAEIALGDTLVPYTVGIEGTDLIVGGKTSAGGAEDYDAWPQGIHRITTGGTYVDYFGNPYDLTRQDELVDPWSSYAYSASLHSERLADLQINRSSTYDGLAVGGSGNTTALGEIPNGHVTYGAGKLWRNSDNATGGEQFRRLFALGGSNIYSRTLLGALQTKSTSQTMQLTYELTLPSSWRGRASHAVLPS